MRQFVPLLDTVVVVQVQTFTDAQLTRAPNSLVKILLVLRFGRLERSLWLTDGDLQRLLEIHFGPSLRRNPVILDNREFWCGRLHMTSNGVVPVEQCMELL